MKLYAEQVRPVIKQSYYVLGTDGFGRSDTRETLRDFFEVDAKHIAYMAIKALADQGDIPMKKAAEALKKLGINADSADPITR
jgi:pyruvate dehydrogenase E1 component